MCTPSARFCGLTQLEIPYDFGLVIHHSVLTEGGNVLFRIIHASYNFSARLADFLLCTAVEKLTMHSKPLT